jgi:hypothetical protein
MSRVILLPDDIQKLMASCQPVEVCTPSGEVVGKFVPDASLYDLTPPISDEEIRSRMGFKEGRSLAEILADLERAR